MWSCENWKECLKFSYYIFSCKTWNSYFSSTLATKAMISFNMNINIMNINMTNCQWFFLRFSSFLKIYIAMQIFYPYCGPNQHSKTMVQPILNLHYLRMIAYYSSYFNMTNPGPGALQNKIFKRSYLIYCSVKLWSPLTSYPHPTRS